MNRSRKGIEIAEPTKFDDGNNRFMNMVNPELYPVEWLATKASPSAFHGAKQNDVQVDPLNPPANLTITTDAINLFFAGPNFKIEHKEQLPEYVKLRTTFETRGGADAVLAWVIMIDVIRGEAPDLGWVDFKTSFKAASVGNLMEVSAFVEVLKPALPDGWGWAEVRDWINNVTREQLTGVKTEIVEVWE